MTFAFVTMYFVENLENMENLGNVENFAGLIMRMMISTEGFFIAEAWI